MSVLGKNVKADRGGIAAGRDVNIGLDEAAMADAIARFADNEAERRALQDEVNRLRSEGQILDRAIITLLADVGERVGDPSQYPGQLRRAGERYQELLAEAERPRNLPPEFEAARREAAVLIREGRLDEADALLMELDDGMAAWEADQEAMLQQGKRDRASVLAERAQIARTRLRYRDAATLLAEAADLTAFDPETSWHHRLAQADVLEDLGRAPRDTRPDDWAMTQNNLGIALRQLGGSRKRLQESFSLAVPPRHPRQSPEGARGRSFPPHRL